MRKNSKTFNKVRQYTWYCFLMGFFMCIATTYGQLQIGAAILGEAGSDLSGYSVSMNTAGNIVAIGAIHNDSNGTNAGHVRVYENNGGVWTQLGQEILGDGLYDQFGYAVSLSASGNILAVGAPKHDPTHSDTTFQGMVRVYEYVNGVWTQIGADLLGTTNTDEFGSGVSINSSGTVLAIGAEGGDYVSIYENMAGTWTQIGVNISTVLGSSNKEVSINATGNRVAMRNAVGTGQVKIYENNAGTWTQLGAGIDGEATGDSFGSAVDLNAAGNIIAIGGPGNDGNGLNAGHVKVYRYNASTWTQIGAEIQGVAFEDQFGGAVSINDEGTIIAAGAIETWNAENGYAQIYQNIAGTWTQIGNTIVGDKTLDRTGFFVSLNGMGDLVAVSAPYADDNGGQSGTTKVYRNENIATQTGLIGTAILGEAAGDQSGMSVSSNATGDIIAIGAPRNDGAGLNNEGHVRVYQNTGGVWTQLGSDIDALGDFDQFGRSVSLNAAGTVVAIGAPIYDVTHSGNAIEGLVQVYEYIDGVWTQVGANIIGAFDDALGTSVSLNAAGTIVAMSAPSNDQFVAVYENKEGVWTQIGANIEVSVYEEVPQAISLNAAGDILAVGVFEFGGNGKVQVYQNNAGTWTQVGADIVGEAIGDQFGTSVSINAAGDTVAIGGFSNDGNGSDSGHVRIYQNVAGTWIQIGADIDGEAAGDLFGVSVSINDTGDVVAIGSNLNDGNGGDSGHVRLYQNLSGIWTQLGSDMDGANAGDQFGSSVALNATGNIVVIGAPENDDNGNEAGHVQVFHNEITVVETATEVGTAILGEAAGDRSGMSVSSNATGDIIAIGAPRNDGAGSDAGHVRVYQNNSGVWTQLGADIDGVQSNSNFGHAVSLNAAGTTIATAGPDMNSLQGAVQVYEYVTDTWTQIGTNLLGTGAGDEFGVGISLNATGDILAIAAAGGDYVAVYKNVTSTWTQIGTNINGTISDADESTPISLNAAGDIVAVGDVSGNGSVKIYQNIDDIWTQVGSDIVGEASGDEFGFSVSVNATGDIVAIGGHKNDGNGSDSGHVRIYQNVAGTWTQIGADIDGEAAGDLFGTSVSINDTGDVVAIGGSANDGNGGDSGHVRLYQNLSGIWTQLGSDMDGANAGDQFGSSVALNATGNIVVAGAPFNDAGGVNAGHVQVIAFESHNTLPMQALLSGPYNSSTNLMDDGLRTSGVIPGASPYGDGAYVFDPEVFNVSGGNAIVDWVLIELRDKNNINTVLESRGALLQRDGDIVDVDGYSSLSFTRQNDNYFVSISHRNHINIVTDTPQSLHQTINFRTASNVKGTTNAVTELTTGIYGLLAGEVSGDGQIQTTDYGLLNALIGQTGYRSEDINMDNQIQTTDIIKLIAGFGSGIQF